jgi:hypothetical protein
MLVFDAKQKETVVLGVSTEEPCSQVWIDMLFELSVRTVGRSVLEL